MAVPNAENNVWTAVGERLREAREAIQPKVSKRAAAKRAGFSEILWRQLESGWRQISKGQYVPISPLDENLIAAARAVDLNPAELFAIAGREWRGGTIPPPRRDSDQEFRAEVIQGFADLRSDLADLRSGIEALTQDVQPRATRGARRQATPEEKRSDRRGRP